MATTPAQPRTPRRRAGAPATDTAAAAAPVSDAAASAPAPATPPAPAKPARKAAPRAATPAATKAKAAEPVAAPAAPAAAGEAAPAAPARKKSAKPAAKAATKPAAKTAAKTAARNAAPSAAPPLTDAPVAAAPAAAPAEAEALPAARKPAAKKAAATAPAKKAAAKKATAQKTPAKKAARKAAADKPATAPAEAVPAAAAAADVVAETPVEAKAEARRPAAARKRSPRKGTAAAAPVAAPEAEAQVAAVSTDEVAAEMPAEAEAPEAITPDAPAAANAAPADAPVDAPAQAVAADAAADATAEAATQADAEPDADSETGPDASSATDAPAGTDAPRERSRRNRRRGRDRERQRERGERPAETQAETPVETQADAAVAAHAASPADAPAATAPALSPSAEIPPTPEAGPAEAPAPAAPVRPPRPARPAPSGPAHSTLACVDGDQRRIVWHTGHGASDALYHAALDRLGADGQLPDTDDDSLPRLLRQAADEGHRVDIDPAVWAQLAARRDARTRAGVLQAAYPDGPASPALRQLLAAPLPVYQAEGALWAVVAGRGLLADERGLGKSVMAIAAAQLWRHHFGVRRVAVISGAGERLAWQRAWRRFAGQPAQVMEGGLHQRQAAWSQDAEVRILAPEALASDAAHLAHWAPELVIVDEPQRLNLDADDWAALAQAPQALVLCGAPLDDQPALLEQLVAWLDRDRLGALAALREVQAAREGRATLDEAGVERVSDALSRSVLQRQRAEVAEQLPPLVYSERLVPLAPAQREAHERHLATLRRVLAGWQASGYLSDTDQWRLATTLRAALAACHRADPAVETSPLADAVVQAVADQLQAWAPGAEAAAPLAVAVLCDTEADAAQLGAALQSRGLARPGLELLAPGQAPAEAPEAVLQVGVPWRTRRAALLPAGAPPVPGQQWLLLVAQDSLETALFDTLAARGDVPRGAADPGGRGFLQGERLLAWLQAVQQALQAMPAALPSVGSGG